MIQALICWTPAVVWAGVLFFLSARPSWGAAAWLPGWADEAAHLVLYAVLGATLAYGRARSGRPRRTLGHLILPFLGILYGLSDEWHQSFVPGRDPSRSDLIADAVGVVVGYSLLFRHLNHEGASGGLSASPRA
ncbi:MAG: VanZ family protein [Gemmatimonadota bacterium]